MSTSVARIGAALKKRAIGPYLIRSLGGRALLLKFWLAVPALKATQ